MTAENEIKKVTPIELKDSLPELTGKLTVQEGSIQFGPGKVNLAIPDRGHSGSCRAIEFKNAGELNLWCQDNPSALIIFLGTRGDVYSVVYNELKTEDMIEEMNYASVVAHRELQVFRNERAEARAAAEKVEEERLARERELMALGLRCVQRHGAVATTLKEVSVNKSDRSSIADAIVKLCEQWGQDPTQLEPVLRAFVAKGVK